MSRKKLYEKWIAALKSGEYDQGHEALKTDAGYCCLGVMEEVCFDVEFTKDLCGIEWVDDEGNSAIPSGRKSETMGLFKKLTEEDLELIASYGLLAPPNHLESMRWALMVYANDNGLNFEQIADFLENSGWANEEEVEEDQDGE